MPLKISIVSDVVCPWCYVGKRRLERALDGLGLRDAAEVAWLPFELNPDMPEGGMPRSEYRARKFGTERSAGIDARMTETGREEGIGFAFDRMARTPNSRRAHILIAHAEGQGGQDRLVDGLFRAYFEEGRDIGDEAVLLDVAAEAGLDRAAAATALRDEDIRRRVLASEHAAQRMGVSGVPFFVVDESWAVSGAQPASDWIEAIRSRMAEGVRPTAAA